MFVGLSFGLATAAHRIAGGAVTPSAGWMAFAALAALGAIVTGRERSGRFIAVTVVSTQIACHALFMFTGMHTMSGPMLASSVPMVSTHLIAALVTAWWLRRGERAAWAAARHVIATLVAPARGLPARPARPGLRVVVSAARLSPRSPSRDPVSRRGPPRFAVMTQSIG